MRPQFPGMDPWLELPTLWPDLHSRLITSIADELSPRLAPRYFVGVGTRTTVVAELDIDRIYQPDVTIHHAQRRSESGGSGVAVLESPAVMPVEVVIPVGEEVEETFIAIQELPGRKLVAVIEVLSPTNKKTADGRREYLKKRDDLIKSRVSLVEIDLLRGGAPMPIKSPPPQTDYRILICRAGRAKSADLYVFSCRSPIPPITIPLLPGDAEPTLDLNKVLHALIERARYDLVIDYSQPPQPPLRPEDEPWAAEIIKRATDQSPESTAGKGTES
jgi:Protein of unknown function (DUF4058)